MMNKVVPNPPGYPAAYQGCRALVTGAGGFIGSWVAKTLAANQARVWMAGRSLEALSATTKKLTFDAHLLCVDLSEPGAFARAYQQVMPDITVNLAGYGVHRSARDSQMAKRMNADLVQEIADVIAAARRSEWMGLRLVHAGSGAEYGTVEGTLNEESPAHPTSLYARTKLAGAQKLAECIQRTGLRATTARLFIVYGPGEHAARLLPSILAAAKSGQDVPLTAGEQLRDFTYVEDVAEGLVRLGAAAGDVPPVVNLASGTQTSVREFAECAGQIAGVQAGRLQFGALPYRPDEVRQGRVDVSLLQQLVGWTPCGTVREGILKTVVFGSRSSERN